MDRETCADCGKEAPQTETNYTLISSQFGWRLTRTKTPSGGVLAQWRCPACWKEFKKRLPGTTTMNGAGEDRQTMPPSPPARGASKTTPPTDFAPKGSAKSTPPGPQRPSSPPGTAKRPSARPSSPARRRPSG